MYLVTFHHWIVIMYMVMKTFMLKLAERKQILYILNFVFYL